jgi:hypothetical protein
VRYLKDNRLLPGGFDKRTAEPDIAVRGHAASDADLSADTIASDTPRRSPASAGRSPSQRRSAATLASAEGSAAR